MYRCQKCDNKKYFIEYNCVKTEVTIDEKTGKITGTRDTFTERTDVECGICKALLSKCEITEVQ